MTNLSWDGPPSFLLFLNDEIERGSDLSDRAWAINSNFSNGWNARGWISVSLGEAARALDAFDRAIRLNPADDWTVVVANAGEMCCVMGAGRYAMRLRWSTDCSLGVLMI
jgi:tetratricopeptide (TPR) repeat protein